MADFCQHQGFYNNWRGWWRAGIPFSLIQGYEKGKLSILQACNLANRFLKRNITGKAGEILATIDVSSLTDEVELENVLLTKFNYLFVTGDHESAEKTWKNTFQNLPIERCIQTPFITWW